MPRVLAVLILVAGNVCAADPPVDFSRQIRPILANHCFACHGPDAAERKSGLRLDEREAALRPADSGEPAVVPEKPDDSPLVHRILSDDPTEVMPPPAMKKPLSGEQKQLLKRWVAEGAKFESHWAFLAPLRPELPPVKNEAWVRNPVDRFLLARLEREGLAPATEADRTTLIRRLSLDLLGLPPTLREIDAFLADTRPDAYERLVDRLMASPRFGERMALDWLDAARFADTNGYHIDNGRDMTRWREWVIDAFNRNLPYDRFTIEQLAGDLLPNPTLDQQIASGFNRNHMINFEGGAIPEEYLTAYIIDRVNTTTTVWLGLTVACTQCHDHKYDPLTQKEFYQFYAFFNSVPEQGLDGRQGNAMPFIKAPTDDQQTELDRLKSVVRSLEEKLSAPHGEWDTAQLAWEKTALETSASRWKTLVADTPVSENGATLQKLEDDSLLATGTNAATDTYTLAADTDLKTITGVRVEFLTHESLTNNGPGRSVNGNIVLTNLRVSLNGADLKRTKATADFSQSGFAVDKAIDDDLGTGWAIHPEVGKPHTAIVSVESPQPSGEKTPVSVVLEFKSGFGQHQAGRVRVSLTDAVDPHGSGLPKAVQDALTAKERSDAQQRELLAWFRANLLPEGRQLAADLERARKAVADFDKLVPTAMVMRESEAPRETFLLLRGEYDKKGDKVVPNVPSVLPPLPSGAPANRLALAKWLVDPAHPLTARVTVNRYWQMLFGTGLVKTTEDFGTQGEYPSHPELLDWLAVDFQAPAPISGSPDRHSWDVKGLIRLLVTSAAYRQSSAVTPALRGRDPENRLLARGARFRLQAEFIRDQALYVSGLMDPRIGGHSVSPYQPPGIWEELASRADGKNWTAQEYSQSHGADLYRRTMYTFWKRTAPPPSLMTFDAPDRETCTVRRARTNTPLQALVLMNDPTYVEASRKLAERVLTEGGTRPEDRLTFAFRLCLSRPPTARERTVLSDLVKQQLGMFRERPGAAEKLLQVGEAPRDPAVDTAELAAWTTLSSVLLNLDETVTKG